jgi:aryl-alcohol dehydrogenase-like predicted oxidoreductase
MRYVSMLADGPKVSVLGLGCSAVLGRSGRRESLAVLGAAWEAGITFYDTARSYGYGESERLLGEFFAGERRQQAVICTKFGILPAARGWKQRVKPLAQAAVRVFPALRTVAQRQAAGEIVASEFSVELLRTSLETSLRALRTDYVDMLLLHAAPISALAQEDLLGAMQRLVEAGTVRMAGISGEQAVIVASFDQRPRGLTTAQFAINAADREFAAETEQAAREGWFLVANHPFGGPTGVRVCRQRIATLRENQALPIALREKLIDDAQLMPEVMLNTILNGTGVHCVIPAMMHPEHLAGNVRAVEQCRFTQEELVLLRRAMGSEISADG